MRVLAASFPDGASARAAQTSLMNKFGLDATKIGVEPLAEGRDAPDTALLAGHFQEDTVAAARKVVQQFGGTMVIDIDDRVRNG